MAIFIICNCDRKNKWAIYNGFVITQFI